MAFYTSDTLLVASSEENFQTLFMRKRRWHGVRVDRRRAESLKWLALYRSTPVSAITHYAAIVGSYEDSTTGRFVFELSEPTPLPRAIGAGIRRPIPIQGQRYVFLDQLLSANEIADLLESRRG